MLNSDHVLYCRSQNVSYRHDGNTQFVWRKVMAVSNLGVKKLHSAMPTF